MIALSFGLFIRLWLWLTTFWLGLHFHGSGFVALHFYYCRLSSRFNLIDHHSILETVDGILWEVVLSSCLHKVKYSVLGKLSKSTVNFSLNQFGKPLG
jgi:hypothetical protein